MQAWEKFLQQQELELGTETVQKWLRNLKVKNFDACNLYLEAKDSFQALWFEEHMRSKVLTKLLNGNNKKITVHLSLAGASSSFKKSPKDKIKKKELGPLPFQLAFDELDPHCLFKNFIVHANNEIAYKILLEATSTPSFNPIYIHGGTGSGKTHLLMSTAQVLKEKGLKTIYVRADTFTDHVVSAIRAGEMSAFRQAYRNIDALLIDDVHIFSRKGATQEEFFHTFNTLHLDGKQIILSSHSAPQELQLIEPRLISRFEWGIVLPVKCLKNEEMKNILISKANSLNFPLPLQISEFLIENFVSSPKALTKALEALILRLHLDSNNNISSLTVLATKALLSDLIIEEQKLALTSTKIIQIIAEFFGIKTEDILGKAQKRECSIPRQIAMYLCRHQLKLPLMKIGDIFNRDHSTVMTAIKNIQKELDSNNSEIAISYHSIIKKL